MYEKQLPDRPNLSQYKKQAKELVRACESGEGPSLARMERNHPRFHKRAETELRRTPVALSDAQLVIAREHGFESWPKFAHHIERDAMIRSVAELSDPVSAFLEVATVPRHAGHASGTLEHAEMILARYPEVAKGDIYTASILGDEAAVRDFLAGDAKRATAKGGPLGWDALTHLCFSRYLRLDKSRSAAFVATARALLDAGASASTGWVEMIDHPTPRPTFESAIYGAAGVAGHAELTRLLLERGADPNDEETPYHVPEDYDNTVMQVVLESERLNALSMATMLVRKADWHDIDGMRMVLEHGGDAKMASRFGDNALHHALRRDNGPGMIELLLEYGADPSLKSERDGRSASAIAAHGGRGDVLRMLEEREFELGLEGVDRLIAACAKGKREEIAELVANEPGLVEDLIARGGTLLSRFAGVGNVEGVRCLLDLGVSVGAVYEEGDGYFEIASGSTALHVAAWKACVWEPDAATVKELIARGAMVNALDGKGRTALELAVKACVDSYWSERRTPRPVAALLEAGATVDGIAVPTGYDEIDALLMRPQK